MKNRSSLLVIGSIVLLTSFGLTACAVIQGGGETVDGVGNLRVISVEREISAPSDVVWEKIFLDFGGVYKFSPKVVASGFVGESREMKVGALRYMHYDEQGKQGVHEQIELLDNDEKRMRFRIVDAFNLPIDTDVSYGDSRIVALDGNRSLMKVNFEYRTKPRILAWFAHRQIKKDMQNMLIGIQHYVESGEVVTAENFRRFSANYQ